MTLKVLRLLPRGEALSLANTLSALTFDDGRKSAAGLARARKANLQLLAGHPDHAGLAKRVVEAYEQSGAFKAFAYPARMLEPSFNLYEPGMHYGAHIDAATMGRPFAIRTDLSATLFLTAPESYDGGELTVEFPTGVQRIKADAGEAVVYPSNTVHSVAPVTRGVRIAAVTWIQSLIRSHEMREILIDLQRVLDAAEAAEDAEASLILTKCVHNLIRHVAEI